MRTAYMFFLERLVSKTKNTDSQHIPKRKKHACRANVSVGICMEKTYTLHTPLVCQLRIFVLSVLGICALRLAVVCINVHLQLVSEAVLPLRFPIKNTRVVQDGYVVTMPEHGCMWIAVER